MQTTAPDKPKTVTDRVHWRPGTELHIGDVALRLQTLGDGKVCFRASGDRPLTDYWRRIDERFHFDGGSLVVTSIGKGGRRCAVVEVTYPKGVLLLIH